MLPFIVPDDLHEIMVSVEDLLGRGGDAYGYRLEAKRQHPDFVAEMVTPFVNMPQRDGARRRDQRRGYAGVMRVSAITRRVLRSLADTFLKKPPSRIIAKRSPGAKRLSRR